MTIARLALLLSLFTTPLLAVEQKKVAVLEFEVTKGLDIDRIYFSDKVRGLVGDKAPKLFVMTRESTEALLQAQGKTMADCAGECEVEIGRKLGADYVISGRLTKLSRRYALTLRLHSTAEGRLVASKEAVGSDTAKLADAADEAVGRLLAPLFSPTLAPSIHRSEQVVSPPTPDPILRSPPASGENGTLEVHSTPSYSDVIVDGRLVELTENKVSISPGLHEIVVHAPLYFDFRKRAIIASHMTTSVRPTLISKATETNFSEESRKAVGFAIKARTALTAKDFPRAIAACEVALALQARDKDIQTVCYRVMGYAYAYKHNRTQATQYLNLYLPLATSDRDMVEQFIAMH